MITTHTNPTSAGPLTQTHVWSESARALLLACGVFASVLYVLADVIAWQRYPEYNPVSQVFSELLAAGAPTRLLMIGVVGIPYNLLIVALSTGVWIAGVHPRRSRLIAVLLLMYALSSFAGGMFFNMDMRGTAATPRGALHPLATGVMSIFILLSVAFAATLHGKKFGVYSVLTLVTLVVFGILVSVQAPQLAANQPAPFIGLLERVNIYAWMVWVAVFAISLRTAATPGGPSA
jgi:hypothetical protein